MRKLPPALANPLEPWITALGVLACTLALLIAAHHITLAILTHRSPA